MRENLIEMAKDGWDVRVILRVFILYQPWLKLREGGSNDK